MKIFISLILSLISSISIADSTDFNNNPLNYNNSPLNFENSTNRYGNENIIRDNQGNAVGYEVEKSDGGVNYFNLNGERQGYKAGDDNH